jgi:hypothetical protein
VAAECGCFGQEAGSLSDTDATVSCRRNGLPVVHIPAFGGPADHSRTALPLILRHFCHRFSPGEAIIESDLAVNGLIPVILQDNEKSP